MNKTVKMENNMILEFVGDLNKSVKNGGALLGRGGQGSVYKVKDKEHGNAYALKVFSANVAENFVENIRNNIKIGSPHSSFLWPLGITNLVGEKGTKTAYLMEYYDNDSSSYSSFAHVVRGKALFTSKKVQLSALRDLASAIDSLHSRGLCYRDLNDGSVMFDCQNGKVLICDNDNIAPSGKDIAFDSEGHCIQGKLKYMAPEVAAGMFKPDEYSDCFSLAVLIFMVLLHAHPFDGIKRLTGPITSEVQKKIYGTEPIFIFDPADDTNRPDPKIDVNAVKYWSELPKFIKNMFVKAFINGLPGDKKAFDQLQFERLKRPSSKEWCDAFEKWIEMLNEELLISENSCYDNKEIAIVPGCVDEWDKEISFTVSDKVSSSEYIGKELSIEKIIVSPDVFFTIISPIDGSLPIVDVSKWYLAKNRDNKISLLDIDGNKVMALDWNYSSMSDFEKMLDQGNVTIIDAFAKEVRNQGPCVFVEWKCENEMHCDVICMSNRFPSLGFIDDLF